VTLLPDILELFRCIDWMLRLPEALEERIWSEMQAYEEEGKMPYVTSVERIGIRKGMAQGMAQGMATSASCCCAKSANASARSLPARANPYSSASPGPNRSKTWARPCSTARTARPGFRSSATQRTPARPNQSLTHKAEGRGAQRPSHSGYRSVGGPRRGAPGLDQARSLRRRAPLPKPTPPRQTGA